MSSVNSLAASAVQMQAASFGQHAGTAIARQQIAAQRSIVDLVASASTSAPPPAGQGQNLDVRV